MENGTWCSDRNLARDLKVAGCDMESSAEDVLGFGNTGERNCVQGTYQIAIAIILRIIAVKLGGKKRWRVQLALYHTVTVEGRKTNEAQKNEPR